MLPASPASMFQAIAPEAAGMPLYRCAKQSLLAAIESGACAAGATLPSETEIAAAMGVSIGTLRRAVDELVAEHVLVRRQGRGTFVARHRGERFLFRFFHLERRDGLREAPTIELLSFERTKAEAGAAAALWLQAGDAVFEVERRLHLQGKAVIHDRLTLPAAMFKGLTERRLREQPGTAYEFYQAAFGVTVLRATERARAEAVGRDTARLLDLVVGAPVLRVERTALTFDDRPVEHRISVINTAGHDYVNRQSDPGNA